MKVEGVQGKSRCAPPRRGLGETLRVTPSGLGLGRV